MVTTDGLIWAVPSFILGAVMWAAQVSPTQARSNVSEWAAFFGLRNQPPWLRSRRADIIIFNSAAILLVLSLCGWLSLFLGVGSMQLGPKLLFGVGCLSLVASVAWHGVTKASEPISVPSKEIIVAQNPPNVTSYNQSGGITAGTVNIGAGRTGFNDQLKADLLQKVPKGEVRLNTVGGDADQAIGNEVEAFLQQNGYSVKRLKMGQTIPPPDHPYTLSVNGNQTILIVAPSAR